MWWKVRIQLHLFCLWSSGFPRTTCWKDKAHWMALAPMDCSQPGSSVHGISQAKILECIAIFFSRRSSWPRDWTWISCVCCIGRLVLYHWATWESLCTRWESSFICFERGHSDSQGLCFEKTPLSPLNGLGTLVESQLTVRVRVSFWDIYSISLVCLSFCAPAPWFDHCCFVGCV